MAVIAALLPVLTNSSCATLRLPVPSPRLPTISSALLSIAGE